jgi:DedD protein
MSDAIEPQLDVLRRRARRRLVGAVVLALAAAVLVPMLLESDPKPLGEDVSVKIPPVDDGRFVSKLGEKSRAAESASPAAAKPVPTLKSPDTATAAAAKQSSTAPPEAKKPPTDAASTVASNPPAKDAAPAAPTKDASSGDAPNPSPAVAAPSPKPASEANPPPSTEATKGAKPPSAAFSVQLAAFADDKGANALANRLKKAGHPAYTEPYASSQGTLWRVRVGPYATRDAAEAARTKLKADGQNGIIAAAN